MYRRTEYVHEDGMTDKNPDDTPVPPDQQPTVPVEEPPDAPQQDPEAPVREPGPTPAKRL